MYGGEQSVEVQAREVAVRIVDLVVRDAAEGLAARAGHGQERNERHEAVFAGQVELGVDPLDLEQPGDVGVEVQTAARGTRGFATPHEATSRARVVARKAAVVRAGLPVIQVELDAEHGLRAADRELEVGTETNPRIPLTIVVTAEVAVVDVAASRRNLVEGSCDRYLRLRRWGLRECRPHRCREDDQ